MIEHTHIGLRWVGMPVLSSLEVSVDGCGGYAPCSVNCMCHYVIWDGFSTCFNPGFEQLAPMTIDSNECYSSSHFTLKKTHS